MDEYLCHGRQDAEDGEGKFIHFIVGDVSEEEVWVRGKNWRGWAMMDPILDICVWVTLDLSVSEYTADYKLLSSETKEINWNWN